MGGFITSIIWHYILLKLSKVWKRKMTKKIEIWWIVSPLWKKNVQCTNSEVECKTTAIDQVLQNIKNSFQNVKLIIFFNKIGKNTNGSCFKKDHHFSKTNLWNRTPYFFKLFYNWNNFLDSDLHVFLNFMMRKISL